MARRWPMLVLAALTAVVLFALRETTPGYDSLTGPLIVRGAMHEVVSTRSFDVRVEHIVFARRLSFHWLGEQHQRTTRGVWAVVRLRLAAHAQPTTIRRAVWQGPTGLRYAHTDRLALASGLAPYTVTPGLAEPAIFVFEILPDQMRGATLVVSEALSPRLDAEAHISLDALMQDAGGALTVQDGFSLDTLPEAS